jgi:hypothetical protein
MAQDTRALESEIYPGCHEGTCLLATGSPLGPSTYYWGQAPFFPAPVLARTVTDTMRGRGEGCPVPQAPCAALAPFHGALNHAAKRFENRLCVKNRITVVSLPAFAREAGHESRVLNGYL